MTKNNPEKTFSLNLPDKHEKEAVLLNTQQELEDVKEKIFMAKNEVDLSNINPITNVKTEYDGLSVDVDQLKKTLARLTEEQSYFGE